MKAMTYDDILMVPSNNHRESRKVVDISTEVPYREDEDDIIAGIIGGLRSGLTYGGAATIGELQRKLDYIEITPAGRTESMPRR